MDRLEPMVTFAILNFLGIVPDPHNSGCRS
jgi:hypothetical protein